MNHVRYKMVADYPLYYVSIYKSEQEGTYVAEVEQMSVGWYPAFYKLGKKEVTLFESKRAEFDNSAVNRLCRMHGPGIDGVQRDGDDILVPSES